MMNPNDAHPTLPEYLENPFITALPPLMSEQEVIASLSEKPHFDKRERYYPDHLRCACIMRLARHYFIPLKRHLTLETRLAQLIRQGYDGRNISDGSFHNHLRDNHDRVINRNLFSCRNVAQSTATALSLVGCSGIGKTISVARILSRYPQIIEHDEPYCFQQIAWLKLECPHMGSARQLCLDFFDSIDRLLGTNYFRQFHRGNLDLLSSQVGRVATQHGLGLLVIDEIQHLISGKGKDREQLLNFLLALINKVGVPMLLVGTMAAVPLLNDTLRNARRASGLGSLIWERLTREDSWDYFIDDLWRYQWTRHPTQITKEIKDCFYKETQGIFDLAVKLFILAQFYAIQLSFDDPQGYGSEQLTADLLHQVAEENFKLLKPMLTALTLGDRETIASYDDIRPFHDHILEIFNNAIALNGKCNTLSLPQERPVPLKISQDAQQQVRWALAQFGVAPDIIDVVLTNALAKVNPDDPLALIAASVEQLQTGQLTMMPPATPTLPTTSLRKLKPAWQNDDLRSIVAQGKEHGRSAHQSLNEAGLIFPAEQLYRVS
jgi:hypothetical protein